MILLLVLAVLILAAAVTVLFLPEVPVYSQSRLKTSKKLIALTFDDGPNPDSTERILNILENHGIKASFFVVGKQVDSFPELVRKTAARGHLIANHSYKHRYSSMLLSPRRLVEEINATNSSINKTIKRRPIFYRPPYGFRTPWGASALQRVGYFVVTWNDMTNDYWDLPASLLAKRIIGRAKPGGIIVLHDGHEGLAKGGFKHRLDALPVIIKALKDQGYRFVRLDELFDVPAYF